MGVIFYLFKLQLLQRHVHIIYKEAAHNLQLLYEIVIRACYLDAQLQSRLACWVDYLRGVQTPLGVALKYSTRHVLVYSYR